MSETVADNTTPKRRKVDKGLAAILFPMLFLVYSLASLEAMP